MPVEALGEQKWQLLPTFSIWTAQLHWFPLKLLINSASSSQSSFGPQRPLMARGWSPQHKRYVKERDPEASLGCTGFLCSHLQRLCFFFTGSKIHKQIKLWKWDLYSKVLNSPATPSRQGIDKHKFFDNVLLLMVVPGILICCYVAFTLCYAVCEGLPHRCTSALSRFQQHSDGAVCLVQRRLLVIRRHGGSWGEKKRTDRNFTIRQRKAQNSSICSTPSHLIYQVTQQKNSRFWTFTLSN